MEPPCPILHDLALSFSPGIGVVTLRNLVNYFGSSQAVMEATKDTLQQVEGVGHKISTGILAGRIEAYERANKEMAFAKKHGIEILTFSDKRYPQRLRQCYDAPSVLYYRGTADLNSSRVVSIVGSRNATIYGKKICVELMEGLTDYNVLVVSGLAYGIDSCAHKESVKYSIPTVGVLGHGLDMIYPAANRKLAVAMLGNGGLLTEFPSLTKPDRQNFPQRNRIIAGLADVVIVIEAAMRGGALITAEIANNYNRDVCAFPGNIDQEYSEGCNFLIKSNRAHLISRVKDLEYLMNWEKEYKTPVLAPAKADPTLTSIEKRLVELINKNGPIGIDEISSEMQVIQGKIVMALLELEMKGLVVALPGKVFRTA